MAKAKGGAARPTKLAFEYRQASNHRAVYADGAIGGPVPQQPPMIRVALYREFPVYLPEVSELVDATEKSATIGRSIPQSHGDTINVVREIDTTLVITAKVARQLSVWLSEKADEIEEVVES